MSATRAALAKSKVVSIDGIFVASATIFEEHNFGHKRFIMETLYTGTLRIVCYV